MGKGVYTMENKDANTDYLKSVTVGDQNWEIAEFTIGIFFFAWDLYSLLFFIKGVFKSHLKKAPHLANSHPKRWFDLSPSQKN